MLHLGNPNLSPPGSFRFIDPELGAINPALARFGPHHALQELENELNKRRQANGLQPLSTVVIQDRICQSLPPGICRDELGHPTTDPGTGALNLAQVVQGTKTLVGWFLHGRRRVSADETVRRSYLCIECPHHKPITGCQGCSGAPLRAAVNEIVGGANLPTDAMLGACGVCGCSLVAKSRLEVGDILPHMSEEQRKHLWEKCWLREPTP